MNQYLKISADVEDDGTVGLTGFVTSGGFSGTGEAWFNITEVETFISQLEKFAMTTENPPEISGGYWDDNGKLAHKLFGLRFYSFSSYRAGVRIDLSNHPYTDCRPEEISFVSLELKPESQSIINFCNQLSQLLSNNVSEANLVC